MIWALVGVLGLPALAQAQLFPNASIKRKRPPCSHEPPVYRMYREQYYGYFPTCWRRFPPGWGCPTPEAPPPWDIVQREAPIRRERDVEVPSIDTELPEGGAPPATELPLPDAPSPFEIPEPGGTAPDTGFPPLNAPEPPSLEDSPFEINPQPPAPPDGSPSAEAAPGDLGFPELAPLGGIAEPAATIAPPPSPGPDRPAMPTPTVPPEYITAPPVAGPAVAPGNLAGDSARYRAPRRGIVAGVLDRIGMRRR